MYASRAARSAPSLAPPSNPLAHVSLMTRRAPRAALFRCTAPLFPAQSPVRFAPRAVRRASHHPRTSPAHDASRVARRGLPLHGALVPRAVHSCYAVCIAHRTLYVRRAFAAPSTMTAIPVNPPLRFALPAHRPRLFLPFLWQQAVLGVRRARAPPAWYILAPAPVSYAVLGFSPRAGKYGFVRAT